MSAEAEFKFCLFVAGDTKNSVEAWANLIALCREHLPARHEIEIVDVFRDPARALESGIFMTPTLLKMAPAPMCRIVGTLSDVPTVLQALRLEVLAP